MATTVYFIRHIETGYIKIGASDNFQKRIWTIVLHHGAVEVLGVMTGGLDTEKQLHSGFADDRAKMLGEREWYHPNDDLHFYIQMNVDVEVPEAFAAAARNYVKVPRRKHYFAPFKRRIYYSCLRGELSWKPCEQAVSIGVPSRVLTALKAGQFNKASKKYLRVVAEFFGCTVEQLAEYPVDEVDPVTGNPLLKA